jgi:hypothetical protein
VSDFRPLQGIGGMPTAPGLMGVGFGENRKSRLIRRHRTGKPLDTEEMQTRFSADSDINSRAKSLGVVLCSATRLCNITDTHSSSALEAFSKEQISLSPQSFQNAFSDFNQFSQMIEADWKSPNNQTTRVTECNHVFYTIRGI